jgi:hypothetical protein
MVDLSVAHIEQFASQVSKQAVDVMVEVSAPVGLMQSQQLTLGLLLRRRLGKTPSDG